MRKAGMETHRPHGILSQECGAGGGEQLPGQRWKMPPVRPPPLRAETIPAWKFSRGNLTEATRREQNGPGFVQEEGPGFGGGPEGANRMKNKC